LPASIRRRIAVLGFLRSSASTDADTKHPQSSSPASPTYEEINEPASVTSDPSNQYELLTATSDGTASPSSAARDNHALRPTAPADSLYSKPHRPRPRPPAAVSAAAAAASVPARNDGSAEYRDTSTTLVDNPLYYDAQQPVTSSNPAYAGGDVTDLTVIDNDLYEREDDGQGQQNLGFADYECTLVDNDLYR